ncbi:hypothetical protein JCM10212_004036 [Sporobolomyces blumeae]
MSTSTSSRASSPASRTDDPDPGAADRLAHLERLLADSLYSRPASPPRPPPVAAAAATTTTTTTTAVEHDPSLVSFRLFSTQTLPTSIAIRSDSPPPPVQVDPRIRATEDEPKHVRRDRRKRIESCVVQGQDILDQVDSVPSPYPPTYRLSHRKLARRPHAPSTSTRAPLPFARLAYLDAEVPPELFVPRSLAAPQTSPTTTQGAKGKGKAKATAERRTGPDGAAVDPADAAADALPPKEPNERLIRNGPYPLVRSRMRLQRDLKLVPRHNKAPPRRPSTPNSASTPNSSTTTTVRTPSNTNSIKDSNAAARRDPSAASEMARRLPLSLSDPRLVARRIRLALVPILDVEKEEPGRFERILEKKRNKISRKVRDKRRKAYELKAREGRKKKNKAGEGQVRGANKGDGTVGIRDKKRDATREDALAVDQRLEANKKSLAQRGQKPKKRVSKARRERIRKRGEINEQRRQAGIEARRKERVAAKAKARENGKGVETQAGKAA